MAQLLQIGSNTGSCPRGQSSLSRLKRSVALLVLTAVMATGCADAVAPKARDVSIPAPKIAEERAKALNEGADPVIYLPLGKDVLVPQGENSDPLPDKIVGPFELRSETLAGALQLVLDGTNIPVAFETEKSLTKTITVTNLQGPLDSVVHEICSLGDMYCSYKNGMLVVKDTQVFTVSIPPIVSSDNIGALLTNISAAVGSITGATPITDASTRTIVYRASQRTSELASQYFQRLRSSTALVVFETYVWEVSLTAGNSTGIKWSMIDRLKNGFEYGINLPGATDTNVGTPISIGLPTTGAVDFSVSDVLQFISAYGAVKTVSQPQITVLSGSSAKLRVADTQNYVASLSRTTTDGGTTTVSTTTDSVDSGFTLQIGSNWDNSTVYGNIDILLQEVRKIDTFDDNPDAVVQLPQTTERELQTQVRVRPGDLLLIAGLVRETDSLDKDGLGMSEPTLPFSRTTQTKNTELVFLMRPRVIVFTNENATTPRKAPQAVGAAPVAEPVKAAPAPAPVAYPDSQRQDRNVPLPSNPVSLPEPDVAPAVKDNGQDKKFESVLNEAAPAPMAAPVSTPAPAPTPVPVQPLPDAIEVKPVAPSKTSTDSVNAPSSQPAGQKPSVEINMPDKTSDPAVIINYDALGK